MTTLQAPTSGAVVVSGGNAVATRANSGPVSGLANVGIRRAEIKHGKERGRKREKEGGQGRGERGNNRGERLCVNFQW